MSNLLTGKTRHRTDWRGRLILQVQYMVHQSRDLNGSGYYDDWTEKLWRDAKVTDQVVISQPDFREGASDE